MCIDFLYKCVWNIFQSKKNWTRYYLSYVDLRVKYPLFVSDFKEILIFPTEFGKIQKCQFSWNSVKWETNCCMRTDRNDEANSLRSFANALKNLPNITTERQCLLLWTCSSYFLRKNFGVKSKFHTWKFRIWFVGLL